MAKLAWPHKIRFPGVFLWLNTAQPFVALPISLQHTTNMAMLGINSLILCAFLDISISKITWTLLWTSPTSSGSSGDSWTSSLPNSRISIAAFTPKRTKSQFRAGARASSKQVPDLSQLRTGWFHTGQSQPRSRREQRHDVTANVCLRLRFTGSNPHSC